MDEIIYPESLDECGIAELKNLVEKSKMKIATLKHQLEVTQRRIHVLNENLAQNNNENNQKYRELNDKYTNVLQQLKVIKRKLHDDESETEPKLPRYDEHGTTSERPVQITHVSTINQPQQVYFGDVYHANPHHSSEIDSDKVNKLKKHLVTVANEIAGEVHLPIELHKAIKAVSLQLSREVKTPSSINESGRHYIKQTDLKKMFSCPEGNIQIKQIFQFAKENAAKDSLRLCTTAESKERFVTKHGNNVLVIGQAGIGKTTLTKIVVQMTVDKQLLPETEYILYVPLCKVDFEQKGNLIQLIATNAVLESTTITTEEVLDLVKDNPNVLIIFDGVDEAKVDDLSKAAPSSSHDQITKPSVTLRNLMSGDLLPHAKILWTCRPRQAYELHEAHRPRTILQVLGLAREAQEDLGEQICQENWLQVKKHLLSHPDIFSACYVPAICIITMATMNLAVADENVSESALQSITEVLVYALVCYSRSDHMRGKAGDILKLAHLAWNGFTTKCYVFTEADFRDANLGEEAFQAFLVTYIDSSVCLKFKLLEGDKCSSFSHLIWQEILAAMHFMYSMPLEEFRTYLPSISISHWEVVSKFVFGLCNTTTRQQLARLLSPTSGAITESFEKKTALKKFVMDHAATIHSLEVTEQCAKFLQVSSWLNEANCPEITQATVEKLPKSVHLSGTFFPSDAMCISFLLQYPGKNWEININNIVFVGDSCSILFNAIKKNKCKTPMLYLGYNELKSSVVQTIAECLNETEKLWMINCSMTSDSMHFLQNGIQKLENQVEFLFLNNNPIGDVGVQALSCCLWKLKVINLNSCNVTTVGVESLSGAIKHLTHKIQLNLRNNNIGDSGITALSDCISCIYNLDINNCKISGSGIVVLGSALEGLDEPMKLINMGNNAIGDQGAYALSKCLNKVKELWIKDGGITETGLRRMTKCHNELEGEKPKVFLGQIPGLDQPYVDLF